MAHEMQINGIDIQFTQNPNDQPMCVTYASDGKFKLWQIVDDTDIYSNYFYAFNETFYLKLFDIFFAL